MDSILDTIKQMLGVGEDDHTYDVDLITYINAAFFKISQLTNQTDFYIIDSNGLWSDYFKINDCPILIKTYIYLSVKLLFDPPVGSVLEANKEILKEYEYRIYLSGDKLYEE